MEKLRLLRVGLMFLVLAESALSGVLAECVRDPEQFLSSDR